MPKRKQTKDMTDHPDKEKKSRFGGLLRSHKHEKEQPRPTVVPRDSAYASSETPSGERPAGTNTRDNSDISKLDNNQKLDRIQNDDNLSVKPGTNEVVDRDTGEIVTTVTTTTTTTTTVSRPGGGRGPRKTQQEVKEEVHTDTPEQSAPSHSQTTTRNEFSPYEETGDASNQDTASHNNRDSKHQSDRDSNVPSELSGNPAPEVAATSNGPVPSTYDQPAHESPPIPNRSPMRNSEVPGGISNNNNDPMSPVSPIQRSAGGNNNFSYPNRERALSPGSTEVTPGNVGEDGYARQHQTQSQPTSTLGNLKAAAQGIHGAGDMLRGTFNSSIDKRFPIGKDAERNAAINARNDAVISHGREQIDSGAMRRHQEREIEKEQMRQQDSQSGGSTGGSGGGLSGLLRRKPIGGNSAGKEVAGGGNTSAGYSPPHGTGVDQKAARRHY